MCPTHPTVTLPYTLRRRRPCSLFHSLLPCRPPFLYPVLYPKPLPLHPLMLYCDSPFFFLKICPRALAIATSCCAQADIHSVPRRLRRQAACRFFVAVCRSLLYCVRVFPFRFSFFTSDFHSIFIYAYIHTQHTSLYLRACV